MDACMIASAFQITLEASDLVTTRLMGRIPRTVFGTNSMTAMCHELTRACAEVTLCPLERITCSTEDETTPTWKT